MQTVGVRGTVCVRVLLRKREQAVWCASLPWVLAVEHVPVWLQQWAKEQAVEGTHCHVCGVAGRQGGVEVVTHTCQAAVPHAVQILQATEPAVTAVIVT